MLDSNNDPVECKLEKFYVESKQNSQIEETALDICGSARCSAPGRERRD
jgi:hypothetical protein